MGGDRAPAMVLQGADLALERHPGAQFLLFGDEAQITPLLARLPRLAEVATVHHTDEVVADDAKPSQALRSGRRSSMRLAIDAVRDGRADGVVSAGNTVALKTVEGVAKLFSESLRASFHHSLSGRIGYLFARGALKKFAARLDPRRYNGAMFLGLAGIAVKSHGSTDAFGTSPRYSGADRGARRIS